MEAELLSSRHCKPSPHPIPAAVAERAVKNATLSPASGCLISNYSTASHGYAQIGWQVSYRKNTMTTAHRAAWTFYNGPIPAGMTIDHTCKNRRCVNVEHLRMLTNYENARRTSGWDWPLGECRNGHPNSELRLMSGDKVRCRTCAAEHQRSYRARKRTAA